VAEAKPEPKPAAAADDDAPQTADGYYDEAREMMKSSKTLLAVDLLKKAIAQNPRHAPSFLLMGKAYATLGREQKAIEAFERFVKLEPDHKDAEKLRGVIEAFKAQSAGGP
jgi:cytochrome c-type biogenesis protein CcmH/NrfG